MSRASVPDPAPGVCERRIRGLCAVVAGVVIVFIAGCVRPPAPEPQPAPPAPPEEEAPRPILPLPPDPWSLPCPEVARLEVRKGERVLEAWCRGGGLRVFPIALSREPVGAKRHSGDQRIPEGAYRIAGSPRASRFHLFIPIDYPSVDDANRGLAEGTISRSQHRRILAAHAAGRLPPQDTALGGLLGFHGEGERWRGDLDLDWTEGCVAVADEAIRWIAEHAKRGTPVEIRP
jgi:hypothetical protein